MRPEPDSAKSFARTYAVTSQLWPDRRKLLRIRRVSGFDPHGPNQIFFFNEIRNSRGQQGTITAHSNVSYRQIERRSRGREKHAHRSVQNETRLAYASPGS